MKYWQRLSLCAFAGAAFGTILQWRWNHEAVTLYGAHLMPFWCVWLIGALFALAALVNTAPKKAR